jgi:Putative Actinobacterial Holin-X, holin superfamily III
MRTHIGERNGGIRAAANDVAGHASSIARLELQLAALELRSKAIALGLGVGLAAGAAVLGFLMLAFAFATLAAVFATFVQTWLALLIVTGILLGLSAILGALALGRLRTATPPVPEQAIREAKLTTEAIKQ